MAKNNRSFLCYWQNHPLLLPSNISWQQNNERNNPILLSKLNYFLCHVSKMNGLGWKNNGKFFFCIFRFPILWLFYSTIGKFKWKTSLSVCLLIFQISFQKFKFLISFLKGPASSSPPDPQNFQPDSTSHQFFWMFPRKMRSSQSLRNVISNNLFIFHIFFWTIDR